MWNWLGAALVLAAASTSGFVVARSYSERSMVLRGMQGALTMLLTEISYGATPLPDALERVAKHAPPSVATFFAVAGRLVGGEDPLPAADAWRRARMRNRRPADDRAGTERQRPRTPVVGRQHDQIGVGRENADAVGAGHRAPVSGRSVRLALSKGGRRTRERCAALPPDPRDRRRCRAFR